MSQFEFIFALLGQLLGLSIVEVLGGLARAIEARLRPDATRRVVLMPILAALMIAMMAALVARYLVVYMLRNEEGRRALVPKHPATSDMVSGRKLQPGRPCGPPCCQLVGVDWRRIPPAHPTDGGLPSALSGQRRVSRTN